MVFLNSSIINLFENYEWAAAILFSHGGRHWSWHAIPLGYFYLTISNQVYQRGKIQCMVMTINPRVVIIVSVYRIRMNIEGTRNESKLALVFPLDKKILTGYKKKFFDSCSTTWVTYLRVLLTSQLKLWYWWIAIHIVSISSIRYFVKVIEKAYSAYLRIP